jgi:hypothetical protein
MVTRDGAVGGFRFDDLAAGTRPRREGAAAARTEVSIDEFVIERVMATETPAAAGPGRQSAAMATFSVALGRIAADALASSGR